MSTPMQIAISDIRIDGGTQIRAAISEDVVTEYADRMGEGAAFPPVVLFHDGTQYYLADGFHRCLASQRLGLAEIAAEVLVGTKTDALWFALGANKVNGYRLTAADKKHAILLALEAWPDKSARDVAAQVGCAHTYVNNIKKQVDTTFHLPERVTGKDGKSYPSSPSAIDHRREIVAAHVRAGKSSAEIRTELKVRPELIASVRRELGVGMTLRSQAAIKERHVRMREMAAEGHTYRQIAAALGLSEDGCRDILRKQGIEVPADAVTARLKRHDSTRIIEHMVMDAENLTADVNLIQFNDLDPSHLAAWLTSLKSSRDKLGEFIRRLIKEQQKHGEAA